MVAANICCSLFGLAEILVSAAPVVRIDGQKNNARKHAARTIRALADELAHQHRAAIDIEDLSTDEARKRST